MAVSKPRGLAALDFLRPKTTLPTVDKKPRVFRPKAEDMIIDWLDEELDRAEMADQKLWDVASDAFGGGQAGRECVRSLLLSAAGHKIKFDARVLRIFRTGRMIEEAEIDTLRKAKLLVEPPQAPPTRFLKWVTWHGVPQWEVDRPDLAINGHIDAILKKAGKLFLGEIKSIKEELWIKLAMPSEDRRTNFVNLMKSHYDYVCQWTLYAGASGIKEGFILFESKNTQRRKIFWLDMDEPLFKKLVDVRARAKPFLAEKKLAPIERDLKTDPECLKCDVKYLCSRLADDATFEDARLMDGKLRAGMSKEIEVDF